MADYYVRCETCCAHHGPMNQFRVVDVVKCCRECGTDVCPDCKEEHDAECKPEADEPPKDKKPA